MKFFSREGCGGRQAGKESSHSKHIHIHGMAATVKYLLLIKLVEL